MEIQQVLDIIKSFFDAIIKILTSIGFIKPEEEDANATTGA